MKTVLRSKVGLAVIAIVGLLAAYYILLPLVGAAWGLATNSYSEGRRDVYIFKVSRKGNIKVWEMEGVVHGQVTHVDKDGMPRGWAAVIEDETLVAKLNSFRGDELIRVNYKERYLSGLDTSAYVVESADRLDDIIPQRK